MRRSLHLSYLVSALALGSGLHAVAADLCQGLVQDKLAHPMTAVAKPALGQTVIDPQFGTTIRRITAVPVSGSNPVIKPMYSTISAWNADESKLILYKVGSGHQLYDGRTYAFIRNLNINPPDLEQVYWHTSDPDLLFYVDGTTLIRYHVSTDTPEQVRTFEFCSGGASGGGDPLFTSWDSKRIGLQCNGQVFIYDISTNTVTGLKSSNKDAPQVAPSGTLAFWEGDVVNPQLNVLRTLDLDPFEHASLGRYSNGNDTYNGSSFDGGPNGSDVGTLVTHDLTNASWKVVIGPATGYPYPPSGTHMSAMAYKQPGWVFVSVVGNPAGQSLLDNELLIADTNTNKVCRVAHHRSYGKNNTKLGAPYWAEPHVVPSPSGTRALFGSDWGNGSSVDTYVVELPSYGGATGADLSLAMTDAPDPVALGNNVTYTLTVTNNGPQNATNVTLTHTLPASFSLVSASGGCTGSVPSVTCSLGSLASAASKTVTITAAPTAVGSFNSQASVTAAETDAISSNNGASQTTSVHPLLSVGDATVTEGNSGTVTAQFTVSLSTGSSQTVTVNYATANGTAQAGSDYVATSGNVSFSPGSVQRTINVTVNGDTTVEPDETFFVNLSGPTNATLADAQGLGTIVNDDTGPLPTLSVSDATVTEGNSGIVNAQFTVSLSAASNQTVTVNYATADGTAQAGSDYLATSGNVSFSPGSVQRTINVTVNGDTTVEPDETFFVNLSIPASATLADAQGLGTIINDDTTPPPPPPPGGEAVVWTSAGGVTVSGNSLTKTAATAWGNAGAVSTKSLASGDGYVEFTAQETNTYRMLGLSNGDSNLNWDDIDFSLYPNADGTIRVYEKGTFRGTFGTYAAGDKMRVSLTAGVVRYSQNGTVLYTSPTAPTYPLLVDTSLYTTGATLIGAVVSGNWTATPPPPPGSQAVVWTSAGGVSVSGNSLSKTAATAWGNAGAVSTKTLASGDGYVEFTVQETNTHRMLGLSNGDSNLNWDDIDFGLYLNADTRIQVYEKGVARGAFGNYAAGDKLRVSLLSGVVKYSRNGTVFYTSPMAPTLPLLVDTSLYTTGASLTNVVLGGTW